MRKVIGAVLAGVAMLVVLGLVGFTCWPRTDSLPTRAVAVVALSGGVFEDGQIADDGADRLRAALGIAKAMGVRIVTTRVRVPDTAPPSDASQRRIVSDSGMLARWSIAPGVVRSTRDEAVRVRELLSTPSRIVVVTSPMHTRRACGVFERVGFIVSCRAGPEQPATELAAAYRHEVAGTVAYWLRGWW